MPEYTLKTKHINTKSLMLEITELVESIIDDYNVIWTSDSQRDTILEVIDGHLQDLAEENKIDRWDVICDARNNKQRDINDGVTHLDIEYVQKNCYNLSQLNYIISK